MTGSALGPQTLDPALIRDAESSFVARQIFRGLTRLDTDMLAQPDLASTIEISADGFSYTFRLRANAIFHDGAPIDAAAVAASFNRASDPALADDQGFSLPAAIYLIDIEGAEERLRGDAETIAGIRVIDPLTLTIELRRPVANFLFKLAGNAANIVDVRETDGSDWWLEPNGSGPFTLEQFDDRTIVLRRFERFYDGAPLLEEARILLGSSAAAPLNLYERDEIDLTETPFYSIDRVTTLSDPLYPELRVQEQLSTSFILLNPNIAPFDDRDVRLAIAHGFDREKVARVMFDGKVRLADGLIPPAILGREWPAINVEWDLDLARAALDRAGPLESRPAFYGSDITVALKLALERDLDIEVDAISLDWHEFSARMADRSLPALTLSWIADYPEPANFLNSMFHSRSPENYIGYSNDQVDDLLERAEVELDSERRVALYLDAQQRVIDDAVLIPLYHDVSYTVVKPHVRELAITPIGILSLERVWIEK